ncbi:MULTISPECIES: phosphonate C-P lyase system protein PhnG [Burkholderia cepacia complex]|uniref:Phosphonate C-P lyase system protein PhnG n=1 Tax=Burkholderia contaminans TaxID=488447 RepID=A0A3N8PTN9_9BURK|nr:MULTISPECIES: phosphonate C-P lyase system protein PhnG [Burkholderia cepacia complex]RQT14964.1 phosphonate C-P lyase system protein PhnG [Burkholderia contaminans]
MNDSTVDVSPARRRWFALLARAPRATLESGLATVLKGRERPDFEWLRAPETGLTMVRGRIGGSGEPFNVGETTVTRAALRLQLPDGHGVMGVAYRLGRDERCVELAAMADALLQCAQWHDKVEACVLAPIERGLEDEKQVRRAKTASTRVDFYTMA